MGGSGGYGFYRNHGSRWMPSDLEESLEQTRQRTAMAEISEVFDETVSRINQVDTEALNKHKEAILTTLQSLYPDAYDLRGGGSYTRHTYANGISDVDVLLDLGPFSASDIPNKANAAAVLDEMEERLQQRLPKTKVKAGRMAVTVEFSDGHEIQVLPAFRYYSGFRVPDHGGSGWTATQPRVFIERLRERNGQVNGKLLRCIKLAKVIRENEGIDLKSYHLENIALKAFENYKGSTSDLAMLKHLFNQAKTLVNRPMPDPTGQQEHVDSYLTNSTARSSLARKLAAVEQAIDNAEGKPAAWRQLLRPAAPG